MTSSSSPLRPTPLTRRWASPLLERHYESHNGKEFEKLELAPGYEWLSFNEYGRLISHLASGFVHFANLKAGDKVVIYAETQMEWMLAALATWTMSGVVVTAYATLGEEGLSHAASQTKATLIIADAKLLPRVASAAKAGAKSALKECKHVITISDPAIKPDPKVAASIATATAALDGCGWSTLDMNEVIKMGFDDPVEPRPPTAADEAVIMYTSGTTGLPKGVVISHGNIVHSAAGFRERIETFGIKETALGEVYLAYLPLAHIMEMVVELAVLSWGASIGYGSPHTLTATGVKIKTGTCQGDAVALKPTIMVFAPAVLDKVYAGILAKMKDQSAIVKKLFEWGIASGESNFTKGIVGSSYLYNKIVFKKVQALLGGRLKLSGTGSAPLAPKVQMFVQAAFNVPVRQGYGLTETCAASCVQLGCDSSSGVVGPPCPSTCIKLRDWPEGNYLNADKNDPSIGMPRGEVLIGGPTVCQGYYVDKKKPDADVVKKNEEDFSVDADGTRWFHTGDIGQFTPDGCLQIIDRKKDLVKLQQGEYVALSKVESALKSCPLVELPLCYARSTESYCVALVCPHAKPLKELAVSLGVSPDATHAELCVDKRVVAEVSKQCAAACKGKLVGFEIPKKLALVAETWTPENDLLTAAMKLKRVPIVAKHKEVLDELYS